MAKQRNHPLDRWGRQLLHFNLCTRTFKPQKYYHFFHIRNYTQDMTGQTSCCYPFPMLFKLPFPDNNVCRRNLQVIEKLVVSFISFFFFLSETALRDREPTTPRPTHFYKERRFHKAKMCFGHSPSKASQALVLIPYNARSSFNPGKVSKITLKQFLTT